MVISPFELRYRTEMNDLFEDDAKLRRWMAVETALAHTYEELGKVPKGTAKQIEDAAKKVKLERVVEIENEIHHDLMAMVRALSEHAGDAGRYVHLGATSYDIEDTANALLFRDAFSILKKRLEALADVLKELAKKYVDTVCIGRTHSQHATPTTYGMKFALYYQDAKRNIERIEETKERTIVGKMAGAVGTMAGFGNDGLIIQEKVMKRLGIKPPVITTQIVQREGYAEAVAVLAIIAGSIEKIAKEIRNLQRTEIMEVAEPFGQKQVGSSAMPQKRNPHKSERICSLARIVRANSLVAMENIALEHERDLTNSANERIILSESFIATDYMTSQLLSILKGLEFFPENIKKNLELTRGLIMAERVMNRLVEKGMQRTKAYELVRELSREAMVGNLSFSEMLKKKKVFDSDEIEELLDASSYIGAAKEIVEKAISN